MTKIFISYRRDDSADIAGRIYDWLVAKFGKDAVFKDVDNIPGGVNFKKYLENAVQQCAVELVIIGKQWLDIADGHGQRRLDDPDDFVRIEIEAALSRDIPVIPLLVSGASMPPEDRLPPSLAELTYRNGTPVRRDPDFHNDMGRVITWIEQWLTAASKRSRVEDILPLPFDWINIPVGKVTLEKGWELSFMSYSTQLMETYSVAPFAIAKYPITNAQFKIFVDDGGYREDRYWKSLAQREILSLKPKWNSAKHPRETVNWYEAMAFCRWLAEKSDLPITLPTEMQWQWAAIGDIEQAYPYGNTFDAKKSNTEESSIGKTTPVDRYRSGASPFGVMDMTGNIWEWMLTDYFDPRSSHTTNNYHRVVRGGAWDFDQGYARATYRGRWNPEDRDRDLGFRIALSVPFPGDKSPG